MLFFVFTFQNNKIFCRLFYLQFDELFIGWIINWHDGHWSVHRCIDFFFFFFAETDFIHPALQQFAKELSQSISNKQISNDVWASNLIPMILEDSFKQKNTKMFSLKMITTVLQHFVNHFFGSFNILCFPCVR